MKPPWGNRIPVVTTDAPKFLVWPGVAVVTRLEAKAPAVGAPAGAEAGSLFVKVGDREQRIALKTSAPLAEPSMPWRISR